MRTLSFVLSVLVIFVLAVRPVDARPGPKTNPIFQMLDASGRPPQGDFMRTPGAGVHNAAAHTGTTYYGGTTWDPVDGRWEALIDSIWTFDTGVATEIIVGSAGDYPGVNPYKQAGLHAYMEGWVGIDFTYGETPYFRLLSDTDPRWGSDVCVGADATGHPGVLGGDYSFWCGVTKAEADTLCYRVGQGYGNSWTVCIGKTFYNFPGGPAVLEFDYINETEPGYDFTYVKVDSSGDGTGFVTVAEYDGLLAGHEALPLAPGFELPAAASDSVQVRFCVSSDGAYSDEDGLFPTACGAFAVDNIILTGSINDGPATFEGGDDGGWKLILPEPGAGGDWSNLVDWSTVPVNTICPCDLTGNVLLFEDLTAPPGQAHGSFQDNLAGSPWIELDPAHNGPGKFIEVSYYYDLDYIAYIFPQFKVKWFPDTCPITGIELESPWTSQGILYYPYFVSGCSGAGTRRLRLDFGEYIPEEATAVRVGLGVLSYCRFFGDCSGVSNLTPVFDNVRLGVFGNTAAPLINMSTIDFPQDSFPANGTLRADAPGRFDAAHIANDSQPEINTYLGDTLTVDGATGGAEVHVELRVTPGPGINVNALSAFYASLTPQGGSWYSARMDTTEYGASGAIDGSWMTTYHEEDPHRKSPGDRDLDPNDLVGVNHLANDIFPDNLFTPGTRVDLFFRTKYLTGSEWYLLPDTTGGNHIEWECLPSSMGPGQEYDEWNCVLYVDHFDGRGAQPWIEAGLESVLGTGSNNFEGTNWDRYDVRAPSSQQACFGRPLGAVYGASVYQVLGYNAIVWNSGNLGAFNLVKEDAEVLIPWLTLQDFQGNNLYLSGDGIAQSMTIEAASNPSSLVLLEEIMGVTRRCNTFREENCPPGTPLDDAPCIPLDPVMGTVASLSRSFFHNAQGNGCPHRRSYDVLGTGIPLFGAVAVGDERYNNSFTGGKIANYSSVATDAARVGQPQYRTVLDGVSVHYRRDTILGPCDFHGEAGPVAERLSEVLNYFGNGSAQDCVYILDGVGVEPGAYSGVSSLLNVTPNPLLTGSTARIAFTMAREGRARINVFDLNGRLVNTVLDGIAQEGQNEAVWNGRDAAGREVAAGVYFYRLDAAGRVMSKKMVVVRGR